MQDHSAQVVIVGAGPAGSAAAAALAAQDVDVLLLDRASFPRAKTCGDGLTPRSVQALSEMGLLNQVQEAGALRIRGIRLHAPDGRRLAVDFDELQTEMPDFGLTIPRRTLDNLLLKHARASGARFVGEFHVRDLLTERAKFVGVSGQVAGEPATVRAPLTLLATGAGMRLVQQAGLLAKTPLVTRAARSYFKGLTAPDPVFRFFFDRTVLPGYGWIFPMSGQRANVGAGFFPSGRFRTRPAHPQRLLDGFLAHNLQAQTQLAGARRVDGAKSYPLRADFGSLPTQRDGLLLIGEAAGLVNPINGEGVDYALESGLLAAEICAGAVKDGDLSPGRLSIYGEQLQARYLTLFRYLVRMRDWYVREGMLNLIVRKAERRPRLRYLFVQRSPGRD